MSGIKSPPYLPTGARSIRDIDDPWVVLKRYCVQADGTVSVRDGRRWRPFCVDSRDRNPRVQLQGCSRKYSVTVAVLVLRAFAGPRPAGCEPLHFPDPDPTNNRADNLRWAPRDVARARRMGKKKLNRDQVPQLRALYRAGHTLEDLACRAGVSVSTIDAMLHGRTWADLPDPLGPVPMRRPGRRAGGP